LNPQGKNARCSACHNSQGAGSKGDEPEQLYTDQRFHDIGLPPNYQAASFDPRAPDVGLSRHTDPELAGQGSRHDGHFRTPGLRNIDKRPWPGFVKAYMHNGYFKTLEQVVRYYNTAILKLDPVRCPPGTTAAQAMARDCWPAAEVDSGNPASGAGLLGNLGLSANEEAALVAYMKTLTDSETVTAPKPPQRPRSHLLHRFFRRLHAWN
jgi:cytochrome c peroxidase